MKDNIITASVLGGLVIFTFAMTFVGGEQRTPPVFRHDYQIDVYKDSVTVYDGGGGLVNKGKMKDLDSLIINDNQ